MKRTFAGLPGAFWLLIGGMLINRLGAFVLPFLTLYLKEHEGLSADGVSLVLTAWGLGSITSAAVGGQLADRWGRKPTMLLSLCGGAAALAGLSVAHGLVTLAALAFTLGAVAELYRPAVAAAIADLVPREERARAFGYLTWSFNIAFAVSPLFAGWIVERLGWHWLFAGDAATMLLAALLIAAALPETRPASATALASASDRGAALRDPRLRWMLVAAFLIGLVIVQAMATLAHLMRADGLSTADYGRVMALNGALIALAQPWVVPRLERLGRLRVLPVAALLFGLGFAGHGLAWGIPTHLICIALWTAGETALFPLCNALVADLAPEHLRGRYQGAYWMAWASANVAGPGLGLQLLERTGELGWSMLPLVACGLATAALLAVARRLRS